VATRPERLRVAAPAKINLFLHVTGKRPDGYHDLQSLVAFAEVGDVLIVERDSGFSLDISGPFASGLTGDADNLVLKAARALDEYLGLNEGARFTLIKNLPVASGIGGGSADAAAALRALIEAWRRPEAFGQDVDAVAARLGSDVPVCLWSRTAWMEGRGENVKLLPQLPDAYLVLVNPGVSVSTADVFRRLVIRENETRLPPPAAFVSFEALVRYLRTTRNDLEAPALTIAPVIGTVLDALAREGAAFVRMSGSGATCFGLFETAEAADAAARAIARAEPSWWTCASAFAASDAARPAAI
jgi:4-diphosphocytidyl-2-C-methyl-D-erythritol kinase